MGDDPHRDMQNKQDTDQSLHDSHLIMGVLSSGPLQIHHTSCALPLVDFFLLTGGGAGGFVIDFERVLPEMAVLEGEEADVEEGLRVRLRRARVLALVDINFVEQRVLVTSGFVADYRSWAAVGCERRGYNYVIDD